MSNAELNKNIFPEIAPVFDAAYLADLGTLGKDQVLIEKELIKTAKLIRKMSLRGIVNDLSTKMKDLEKAGKTGEIEKLGNQVRQNLLLLKELENNPFHFSRQRNERIKQLGNTG